MPMSFARKAGEDEAESFLGTDKTEPMNAIEGTFAWRYTVFLKRFRFAVIGLWVIMVVVSAIIGPKFIAKCSVAFNPPKSSLGAIADQKLAQYFPEFSEESSDYVLFIYSKEKGKSVLGEDLRQFTIEVNKTAWGYQTPPVLSSFTGYYIVEPMRLPDQVKKSFLSANENATLIAFNALYGYASKDAQALAAVIEDKMVELQQQIPSLDRLGMELSGIPALVPVIQDSVTKDFELVDGIVMPLAMAILAYIVKSVRLMVLPAACMGCSILTSFAIMYGVSFQMDVVTVAPNLMMSLLVAMSIDYSLFLLTRLREELQRERDMTQAVAKTLETAGHTIVVSGVTLAICFLGLCVFPMDMMQSIGVGCSVAITVTLMSNITLTPALLLAFDWFFIKCVDPFPCFAKKEEDLLPRLPGLNNDESKALISVRLYDEETRTQASYWYRMGTFATKWPYNVVIIIVVVGATIPFSVHALHYTTTDSMMVTMPRGAEFTATYQKLSDTFGVGTTYPYRLVVSPPNASYICQSAEYFEAVQATVKKLATIPQTKLDNFNGLMVAAGSDVPWQFASQCLNASDVPVYNMTLCKGVQYARDMFVSKDGRVTYLMVTLDFDPVSEYGTTWLAAARKVLAEEQARTGYEYLLSGMPSDSLDLIQSVYKYFPVMVGVTVTVVLLIVGLAFRSILVPIRAILTIALTMFWVYGLATMVYQDGLFNFLNFPNLHGEGALYWMIPIIDFSIIVGIGLDYDIFLLVRVYEYRETHPSNEALVRGLSKTGNIITAAGVIMAVAFSGLLLSSAPVMNQLAFYLVFSVLFDTFVVRTLLVPAIMSLLGEANWWPRQFEPVPG